MDAERQIGLAAVVLLSLVLPLTASLRGASPTGLRVVWIGQACLALAALSIVFGPLRPVLGLASAAAVCLTALPLLLARPRAA